MQIDPIQLIQVVLLIIGTATVAFRLITPFTETKKDDKVLAFLEHVLATVALNKSDKETNLVIKLRK